MSRGRLRIIAGELRGRRFPVPAAAAVRPTSDRVREAWFSIVAPRIPDARVLDLFAGSGALGFEAASRGAAEVVFVESDPAVVAVLGRSIRELGLADRCRLIASEVGPALERNDLGGRFELIFADPPYGEAELSGSLVRIVDRGLLAPDGLVMVEARASDSRPESAPGGLRHQRTARYGDTCIDFYAVADPT